MTVDEKVHEIFSTLVAEEPALEIDIQRALRDGRNRRVRRSLMLGGSVVAAGTLVVIGVVALPSLIPGPTAPTTIVTATGGPTASPGASDGATDEVMNREVAKAVKQLRQLRIESVVVAERMVMVQQRLGVRAEASFVGSTVLLPNAEIESVSTMTELNGGRVAIHVVLPQSGIDSEFDACSVPLAPDATSRPEDCQRTVLTNGLVVRTASYPPVLAGSSSALALVYRDGTLEFMLTSHDSKVTTHDLLTLARELL